MTELMQVRLVVLSYMLLKKNVVSLGFPDTMDKDNHYLGLKMKPLLVAVFSMSVISF